MNPEDKKYVLHCNKCSFKRFTNGDDLNDLIQVKTVDVQRFIPRLDPETKKSVNSPDKPRRKMFRCPECGFTLKAFSSLPSLEKQEKIDE
jgi:hypothetical protein